MRLQHKFGVAFNIDAKLDMHALIKGDQYIQNIGRTTSTVHSGRSGGKPPKKALCGGALYCACMTCRYGDGEEAGGGGGGGGDLKTRSVPLGCDVGFQLVNVSGVGPRKLANESRCAI